MESVRRQSARCPWGRGQAEVWIQVCLIPGSKLWPLQRAAGRIQVWLRHASSSVRPHWWIPSSGICWDSLLVKSWLGPWSRWCELKGLLGKISLLLEDKRGLSIPQLSPVAPSLNPWHFAVLSGAGRVATLWWQKRKKDWLLGSPTPWRPQTSRCERWHVLLVVQHHEWRVVACSCAQADSAPHGCSFLPRAWGLPELTSNLTTSAPKPGFLHSGREWGRGWVGPGLLQCITGLLLAWTPHCGFSPAPSCLAAQLWWDCKLDLGAGVHFHLNVQPSGGTLQRSSQLAVLRMHEGPKCAPAWELPSHTWPSLLSWLASLPLGLSLHWAVSLFFLQLNNVTFLFGRVLLWTGTF